MIDIEYALEMQEHWRKLKLKKPEVDPAWAAERKLEYLKPQYQKALIEVGDLRGRVGHFVKRGCEFGSLLWTSILNDALERARKLNRQIGFYTRPMSSGVERITDADIERAREVKLEELVDHDRWMIKCPFHQDTDPSMSIKKGFGYCFVCRKSVDSIGWLMEFRGLNFPDAVRELIR